MKTIWKYPLTDPTTVIDLPLGAQVLRVDYLRGPHLWALVDSSKRVRTDARTFVAYATGEEIEDDKASCRVYIGTLVAPEGLVFHVFEKLPVGASS